MKKDKAKVINIRITHQLTPMHEEIMKGAVKSMMTALVYFWEAKSKKYFVVSQTEEEITRN